MKLRLLGTEQEWADAVIALSAGFVVRDVSAFYPNRGPSVLGRVYVDVEISADRADRRAPAGSRKGVAR
ncbi:MAG TPA: hypothetical protein VGJ95_24045 [Pseudonocardiaceae bacterium]